MNDQVRMTKSRGLACFFRHSSFVIRHFLGGALILLFVSRAIAAEVIPPAPAQYFNDYALAVSPGVASQLNSQLESFEKATSNQIVVAIFPKMQSDSEIADYCQRVFRAWKVGQKETSNGAVLFVFVQDHKMHIHTGDGLEGALPDITCERIIEDEIAPHFKQNDYDGGLTAGINAMMAAARGEYKGTGRTHAGNGSESNTSGKGIALLLVGLFVVFNFFMVRSYGWGFLFNETGWIISCVGSGSSSGRGSNGGGRFSGGGGSSGGGGASGSW